MAVELTNHHQLGETAPSGEQEHLLGSIGMFNDLDPDNFYSEVHSGQGFPVTKALWVKNESGGALTPGTIPTWDTGATYGPRKAVGAAAATGTSVGVGVVDPFLPAAGVADNLHFWLIFWGRCQFLFTTGTALSVGDVVALGAAGRVVDLDHTSLTDQLIFDRCGRCLEAVAAGAANDTLFDGFADFRF